jgi:hypothetical protein
MISSDTDPSTDWRKSWVVSQLPSKHGCFGQRDARIPKSWKGTHSVIFPSVMMNQNSQGIPFLPALTVVYCLKIASGWSEAEDVQ